MKIAVTGKTEANFNPEQTVMRLTVESKDKTY
jgi:hypothetical protein